MGEDVQRTADFESVKTRLAEIAEAVDDQSLSLDEALDLYEEAVALGLKASDLLEVGIAVPEDGTEDAEPDSDSPADSSDPTGSSHEGSGGEQDGKA